MQAADTRSIDQSSCAAGSVRSARPAWTRRSARRSPRRRGWAAASAPAAACRRRRRLACSCWHHGSRRRVAPCCWSQRRPKNSSSGIAGAVSAEAATATTRRSCREATATSRVQTPTEEDEGFIFAAVLGELVDPRTMEARACERSIETMRG